TEGAVLVQHQRAPAGPFHTCSRVSVCPALRACGPGMHRTAGGLADRVSRTRFSLPEDSTGISCECMSAGRQLDLIPAENPLRTRLGEVFFKSVPASPGVYLMRDRSGNVLYVGMSQSLRERLRSYCYLNAGNTSRRRLRMLARVHEI